MIDVFAALKDLIETESVVTDLTNRIYVGEVPQEEVSNLPDMVIVLAAAGGIEHNRLLPLIDPRVQVWCIGKTYYEASTLDRTLFEVFRHIVRRTINGVLIHSIGWSGGPFMVRDDLTGWPAFWRSIVINADARSVDGG